MKKTITFSLLVMTMSVFAGNDSTTVKTTSTVSNTPKESSVVAAPALGGFTKRHVIKVNATPLILKNIPLQYEFGFSEHFSVVFGGSLMIPGPIPGDLFSTEDIDANGASISDLKFSGFSLTPEFRYYPGRKGAPRGFYLAPYFRYSSFNVGADGKLAATATDPEIMADVSARFSSFTGGLMIGSQWLIGKHFAIDWWILGGGYGKSRLTVIGDATSGVFSVKNQQDLEEEIKSGLESIYEYLGGEVDTEVSSKEVKAVVKGLKGISLRGCGLCFGVYF